MSLSHRAKLWTFDSLIQDLGVQPEPNAALRSALIERVDIDAQYTASSSLFIPRGSKTAKAREQDPADQVRRALDRGAAIVLTTEDRARFDPEAPVIQVPNLVTTAKLLASKARARYQGKIVGITGSVGKTTTKDMLRHVLSYEGPTFATRGNYNEIDGVLMTLASMPADAPYSIVEVCSTRLRSVPNKAEFVKPHIGMVTVIGHSHGENYPSRYDILRDKVSMLDYLTGDRIAILGRSVIDYDQAEENLIAQKNIGHMITVGSDSRETVQLLSADLGAMDTCVRMRVDGRKYEMRVPLAGRQYVDAALFTMATAHALQLDLADIAENVSTLELGRRRGERLRVQVKDSKKVVEVIDDAQNSSPESVRALLENLSLRAPKRKVLVLGDMLELGDKAPAMHDALAEDVAAAGIDLLLTVGPLAERVAKKVGDRIETRVFQKTAGAATHLPKVVEHGDLIALKGSGGLTLENIMRALAPPARRTRATQRWTVEHEAGRTLPETRKSIATEDSGATGSTPGQDAARIEDFGAFLYKMPLKKGFKTSRFTTKVSSNYVLAMRVGSVLGLGEASPRSIALTGDNRPLANKFFREARKIIVGTTISTSSAAQALEDVRALMARLEKRADALATDENRAKPFRACLAGIDIMLLDGAARLHDLTLAQFLGVKRPDVGVTATTLSVPAEGGEKLLASVRNHLKRYPACRAKGASDTALNLEILRAITTVAKETGQDKIAWVDMNEAYDPETGADLIRAIAAEADQGTIQGTVILEQPLPKRYYKEMCELQALAKTVTGGKNIDLVLLADESLWDIEDLKVLQAAGGCSGINIKVQKCGGLLKAMKIGEAAQSFNPDTRIYIGGMIGTSDLTSRALLSLATALPRFDYITSGPRSNIEDFIVTKPLRWVDKTNKLPAQTGPGLGLDVAWDTVLKYVAESHEKGLQAFLKDAGITAEAKA